MSSEFELQQEFIGTEISSINLKKDLLEYWDKLGRAFKLCTQV